MSQKGVSEPSAAEILNEAQVRWRRCVPSGENPESFTLCLGILRDLSRALHGLKSVTLASPTETAASKINNLPQAMQFLPGAKEIFAQFERTSNRPLPATLKAVLPSEKLERADRTWERAIFQEALAEDWRLWEVDAWVELHAAQAWHGQLEQALRRGWEPRRCEAGVLLFAEAVPEARFRPDYWHGRWLVVLGPEFQAHRSSPELGIQDFRGGAPKPEFPPPHWNLLFSLRTN